MKKNLEAMLHSVVESFQLSGDLAIDATPNIIVERARGEQHGDFASNIALALAKPMRRSPRDLAERIIAALPATPSIDKVEIAGPGFINFFLNQQSQFQIIRDIHQQGHRFGHGTVGAGKKVQVEFVSANPTGPLHVGHGRGAAYGSVVSNLLTAVGFEVDREYYVNDAGRQMDILAVSIWLRYLEECGESLPFPTNGYRGEYIREIAWALHQRDGSAYCHPAKLVLEGLTADEPLGGDKEAHIDDLIARAITLVGTGAYRKILQAGLDSILADIRDDLGEFGLDYQAWFSEHQLVESGAVERALEQLQSGGHLYQKEGATWFASRPLGDEKDRVVVRENGQYTYFASDIAYHMNKLERGYDRIIDVWGADHHGYIPRVRAALQALGAEPDRLTVLLVQFAVLYRGEEKVAMSTRSGEFVTLRQLRNEVGKDAVRFFYTMRRSDQHMDFDLKLACSQSNENPVYYVQYAHARVCSVLRQLDEKGLIRQLTQGMEQLERLIEPHETTLIATLNHFPEVVERAALNYEPHQLIHYLRGVANEFHAYYNAHQFLVDDAGLRDARLNLICAVRQVIANGLALIDVSAPESM